MFTESQRSVLRGVIIKLQNLLAVVAETGGGVVDPGPQIDPHPALTRQEQYAEWARLHGEQQTLDGWNNWQMQNPPGGPVSIDPAPVIEPPASPPPPPEAPPPPPPAGATDIVWPMSTVAPYPPHPGIFAVGERAKPDWSAILQGIIIAVITSGGSALLVVMLLTARLEERQTAGKEATEKALHDNREAMKELKGEINDTMKTVLKDHGQIAIEINTLKKENEFLHPEARRAVNDHRRR